MNKSSRIDVKKETMVSADVFRQLALSFDETTEQAHFEKASFRVHKKIFATLDVVTQTAVLKLSDIDQSVFCAFDPSVVYPADKIWGRKGWTVIALQKISREMLQDALTCSYCQVAPGRLSAKYKNA